jgi:hypothetical protein
VAHIYPRARYKDRHPRASRAAFFAHQHSRRSQLTYFVLADAELNARTEIRARLAFAVPAHRRAADARLFYQVDERKLLRICEAASVRAAIALRNGGCGVCEVFVERLMLSSAASVVFLWSLVMGIRQPTT